MDYWHPVPSERPCSLPLHGLSDGPMQKGPNGIRRTRLQLGQGTV